MVETISPNYYAADNPSDVYNLIGSGFEELPNDAVGILAISNDDPLGQRYAQSESLLYAINVVDDNTMTATCNEPTVHSGPNYLGAILSADRETIYWVNNTKPLP